MVNKVVNNDASAINSQDFAVVDFSAVWCGPCKMLAPVIDELSEEMGDKAAFYNVDVDENSDLAGEYNVMNIPTIVFLKNGKEVGKQIGFIPKEQMKSLIEEYSK